MSKTMVTVLNDRRPVFAPWLRGHAEAVLMVTASTLLGLMIAPHWGNAPVVLLYIPAVLAAAVLRGLGPAVAAAIVSTLAYNFFFTAPYYTLLIHSAADVVTVVILLLVALVTSRLAGSMRQQARLAEAHAERNATIAGFARGLLSCGSEDEISLVSVNELSRLFECHAILVAGADKSRPIASAPADMPLNPGDHAALALTLATAEPAGRGIGRANLADWQFHPVTSVPGVIAALGLAREDGTPPILNSQMPLLGSLLDQLALAIERARLEREAREFATLRERDRIRSALLASIGQDVKPRLIAIMAAARALRRGGSGDKALVSAVAAEAAKLDLYVDNLLNLSPASDQKPVEIGAVTIDLFQRSVLREGAEVRLTPKEYGVLAELAKHPGRVLSHSHLLRTVWGRAHEGQIEYLRVAVRALRQKLERDPARPEIINNEPAVGYRLKCG
jgi:two-component system sensor histidine kinase KdpD